MKTGQSFGPSSEMGRLIKSTPYVFIRTWKDDYTKTFNLHLLGQEKIIQVNGSLAPQSFSGV